MISKPYKNDTANAAPVQQKMMRLSALVFCLGAFSLDLPLSVGGVKGGNLVLIALCAISFLLSFSHRSAARGAKATILIEDVVFFFYIFFCLLSTTWSVSPADTVFQCFLLFLMLVSVLMLSCASVATVLRAYIGLSVILAVLSFAIVPIFPDVAFQKHTTAGFPELKGVFFHQQRAGLDMAIASGILIIAYLNGELGKLSSNRKYVIFAFLVITACMVFALARLFTVSMLVALMLAYGFAKNQALRYSLTVLIGLFLIWVVVDWAQILDWLIGDGVDVSLSGRTNIWQGSLFLAEQRPWTGYGFATFVSPAFDFVWGRYRPGHAHNSLIQAFFETGYIGMYLVIATMATHVVVSYKTRVNTGKISYSFFLVLLTIISSASGLTYGGKPSTIYCLTILLLAVERREMIGFYQKAADRLPAANAVAGSQSQWRQLSHTQADGSTSANY